MEGQVYRIEIPVEVVDKTDVATLKRLETALKNVFDALEHKESGEKPFEDAATGAKKAVAAVKDLTSSFDSAGNAATGAGKEQAQAAKTAESATEKLENAVEDVADAYDDTSNAAADAGQKSGSAFEKAGSSADKFTQRMEKSNKSLKQMFKEKWQLTVAAIDKASPVLKTIGSTVKSLTSKAWSVAVRMKDFITAPFRKIASLISSPITMALSVAGIGLSASDVINTFNEFETGMSAVRSLTSATDEEFSLLRATAKDLGATTSFSASEASQGMQYLAMAGWNTNQIIAAMPGLLDLAAAGATDLGVAADIVSDVMTAMGMAAGEAGRAADVFAKTATSSNTTIEGLGDTLKYAAPIAHSFGMELEEVAALAGMMGNAGIKGSQAGTAMRSALLRMADPAKEAQTWMRKLGLSFADNQGRMKSMSTIMRETQTAFSKLTEEQKLSAAQAIFGTEAASAWLGVIDQGADTYDKFTQSLYDANGAAEQMADVRLDNLAGDMEELGGAIETAKLELMEKLDPFLRSAVQWLIGEIPGIQDSLENAIDAGIAKGEELKAIFSGDDFQNADGFAEKFFVAWDKIVAEPFASWWNNDGKEEVLQVAGDIGGDIGKLIHGFFVGAFAALKGEDIDFDGLNITGISKAAAETAKEFITSFASGLDLGGIFGEMPGLLKLGILGLGASKLGIFKLLSMIPMQAMPAVAAIAAVTLAFSALSQAALNHKQELLELGDNVEHTTEAYQQTARAINETVADLDSLNRERRRLEFVIGVAREGLTDEQITNITERIGEIEDDTKTLTIKIQEESDLAVEDIQEYANKFAQIQDDQVHLLASIITISGGEKAEEVYNLLEKYQLAQFDDAMKAQVTAQIVALCPDTEKAEEVYDLLQLYNDPTLSPFERATVAASIIANTTGNTDATAMLGLLEKYSDPNLPESDKVAIEAELEALCENPATAALILPLFKSYADLESKETAIEATLTTNGVTSQNIEDLKTLASLINERDTLTLALEGANLSPEELAEYERQYEETLDKITELTNGAVDARNLEADAINSNIELLKQQLEIEKEIAALKQQGALLDLEGRMPDVIKEEEKAVKRVADIQAEYDAANATPTEAYNIQRDFLALENRRKEMENQGDSAAYWDYYHGEGGYLEQAESLFKRYQALNGVDEEGAKDAWYSTQSMISDNLAWGGDGSLNSAFGGDFFGALDSYVSQNADYLADLEAQLEAAHGEAAKYTNERKQYYEGKEAQQTAEYFKGTQYEGMNLKDIAAEYSEFSKDLVMRAAFQSAVDALDNLNTNLIDKGWLSEEEATTVDQINAIRDASFPAVEPTIDPVTGEATAVQMVNVEQAIATLSTQNQMKKGDTKFTRDLEANEKAYNKALKADYGSDLEKEEALNAILLERKALIEGQQEAISQGIQGIEQLDMQIVEKQEAIAEKRAEIAGKDYEGARETVRGVNVAMQNAEIAGTQLSAEEASAAIESVNAALESLGLEKIASLDQLSQALESINTLQTEDQSALATLNDELGMLEASRIELLVQATNALDSLTWNINQINSDKKLDDSLKIGETTISSVEGLRSKIEATGGQVSDVRTKVSNLQSGLDELAGDYEVRVKYIFSSTQSITLPSGAVKKNANGGIYDGAMLSWVAEDGPEAIIPLSSERRDRGLDLWLQAGRMLGVNEFADGGILAPYAGTFASFSGDYPEDADEENVSIGNIPVNVPTGNGSGGGNVIHISVENNPTFEVEGGNDPEAVLEIIRSKQYELADILGSAIAEQLEDIIENMV